jgi:hypothetical protein
MNTIQTRGHTATRVDVLEAIDQCDLLGQAVFLKTFGYADSVRYHLRHNGRSYPSKAIVGVALGLESKDFFGGARETVRLLGELGFHVRNSDTGEIIDKLGLELIREEMVKAGFDDPVPDWPTLPVCPSAYFASGSNRPGEIAALGKVGADIGVAVNHLSEEAILELENLAGSDVLVFVDSGAFSEVTFGPEGVTVVKPILHADWIKRLKVYSRLGRALGNSVYCVAPDRVGDQELTLERLATYATELSWIRDTGARILVPIQKGELTQVEFAERVDEILQFSDWLPALPCKKAATTAEEVAAFVRDRQPRHVHLLGLGIHNRNADAYVAPFVDSCSSVSLDSCWIAANVGRNPKRRRFTKARDIARQVLEAAGRYTTRLNVEAALFACFTTRSTT